MTTKRILSITLVLLTVLLAACSFSNSGEEAQPAADESVELPAAEEEAAPAEAEPAAEEEAEDAVAEEPVAEEEAAAAEEPAAEEAEPVEAEPAAEPFDVGEMEKHLAEMVVRNDDLPDEYRLPPGGEKTLATSALINIMGEAEAKQYTVATGRVTGWQVSLERVKKDAFAPNTIENSIELFETAEGAQKAISETWYPVYSDGREFEWVEGGCSFGDQCIFYFTEKFEATTQLTTLTYELAFTYRNTLVWIQGRGIDYDITPEYMLNIAEAIELKLDRYAQTQ